MFDINVLLTVANILFGLGAIVLTAGVIKDRTKLHGYPLIGSLNTLIALILMAFWYGVNIKEYYTAFIFNAITLIYWLIVVIFKIKSR